MKKHLALFLFLLTVLLANQIQVVRALQKTYEWNIPSGVGGSPNTYIISLITSDGWQVDTTVDVTFRLTLTYKSSTLADTETEWVKIVLSSENFIMDSGSQTETVILRNIGDYWEKKVSFYIPPEKVNRGQTLNVSTIFVVSMNTIDNIQLRRWDQTAQSYDNPMYVGLFRPLLSTLETIIVAVVVIVIGGASGFMLYRRRRVSVKPPSPSTQ